MYQDCVPGATAPPTASDKQGPRKSGAAGVHVVPSTSGRSGHVQMNREAAGAAESGILVF